MSTARIPFNHTDGVVDVPFVERIEKAAKADPLRAMTVSALIVGFVMSIVMLLYSISKNEVIQNLETEKNVLVQKIKEQMADSQKLAEQLKGQATLRRNFDNEVTRKKELATLYEREKARRVQAERDHAVAIEQVRSLQKQLSAKSAQSNKPKK